MITCNFSYLLFRSRTRELFSILVLCNYILGATAKAIDMTSIVQLIQTDGTALGRGNDDNQHVSLTSITCATSDCSSEGYKQQWKLRKCGGDDCKTNGISPSNQWEIDSTATIIEEGDVVMLFNVGANQRTGNFLSFAYFFSSFFYFLYRMQGVIFQILVIFLLFSLYI